MSRATGLNDNFKVFLKYKLKEIGINCWESITNFVF